jgi:hypothetical protein
LPGQDLRKVRPVARHPGHWALVAQLDWVDSAKACAVVQPHRQDARSVVRMVNLQLAVFQREVVVTDRHLPRDLDLTTHRQLEDHLRDLFGAKLRWSSIELDVVLSFGERVDRDKWTRLHRTIVAPSPGERRAAACQHPFSPFASRPDSERTFEKRLRSNEPRLPGLACTWGCAHPSDPSREYTRVLSASLRRSRRLRIALVTATD